MSICSVKIDRAQRRKIVLLAVAFLACAASLRGVRCAPASFHQATADYNAGRHAKALSEFEAYMADYPGNALVRYYIALCHQELGHNEAARVQFDWVSQKGDARLQRLAAAALKQLSALPSGGATKGSAKRGSVQPSVDELESYCLSLINESRHSEGVAPVQPDASLSRLARQYADYMAQNSEQYEITVHRSPHTDLQGRNPRDRAAMAGISTMAVNECIGRTSRGGSSDQTMILTVHRQMMAEPPGTGHRYVIMDPNNTVVGVGVARLAQRLYLTEEFGQPLK